MSDSFAKQCIEESHLREKTRERDSHIWEVRWYTIIGAIDAIVALWFLSHGNWLGGAVVGVLAAACIFTVQRSKKWLKKNSS